MRVFVQGTVGLSEINKNSGAHQKNFNEGRRMSVVAKCRPMHLFVIYKVYADIRRGSIGEGGVKYNRCNRLAVFHAWRIYTTPKARIVASC